MTQIWERSPQKGTALLLLLAIADFANDEGVAYPSIARLAAKTRVSERSVHYVLKSLKASGELEISEQAGPRGCNLFRVKPTSGVQPDVMGGATQRKKGVQPIAPEPSLEPSLEPSVSLIQGQNGSEIAPLDADRAVWPDWYSTLYAIPGFTISLAAANAWLTQAGISEGLAERKAYALKGSWPGNPKRPYRDPWATFQNWAKSPQLVTTNPPRSGATRVEARRDMHDYPDTFYG